MHGPPSERHSQHQHLLLHGWDGLYFTSELAAVPMAVAPVMRLRRPDEITALGADMVLLAYKRPEDG